MAAKKPTPTEPGTDLVVTQAPVPPVAADGPTPENTPVPGGGRWRWDIAKPGWVDLDAPEPEPAPQATNTDQLSE